MPKSDHWIVVYGSKRESERTAQYFGPFPDQLSKERYAAHYFNDENWYYTDGPPVTARPDQIIYPY